MSTLEIGSNSTGAITYVANGDKVRVIWAGEGDLFPVIGGIFKGAWESGVIDYYDYALSKLKQRVEKKLAARKAEAKPENKPENKNKTGAKAALPAAAGVADAPSAADAAGDKK